MRKSLLLILGLLVVFSTFGPLAASARQTTQQDLPSLFAEPESPIMSRDAQDLPDEVIRSRQVEVNTDILVDMARSQSGGISSASMLMLNLFDDTSYIASINKVEEFSDGSYGLVGYVNTENYNELIMVVRDNILQGYLQDGSLNFEIRYEKGYHTIREVNAEAYPQAEDVLADPFMEADPTSSPPSITADLPQVEADSAAIIDVLAVYTPAARNAFGSVGAIETAIQQSILSTNEGYTASGISQQIRLVGMKEVSYTEEIPGATNTNEWYAALERLTFGASDAANGGVDDPSGSNYLADARAYRDSLRADLVFMVTALPYVYCGLGWIGGGATQSYIGYSVMHANCTGYSSYSVQHEMGHNMGACHDRANSSITCMYDYSYGYQQPDQFYTVMGYSYGCGNCSRINRWSNPDLSYNGYPTGVAITQPNSAHNALTLNNTAYNIANYRQSTPPITASFTNPSQSSMIPHTNLEVSATSNGGSIIRVTFAVFYDYYWHTVNTDSNGADGWAYIWPSGGVTPQNIHFRAIVEDNLGNSNTVYKYNISLNDTIVIGGIYESRDDEIGRTPEAQMEAEPETLTTEHAWYELPPAFCFPWQNLPH